MKNENTIPRVTGLLIIEARNSNPNGDPDRESDPRTRAHDGRGVISDVSFKRKLRELILNKEGPVWKHLSEELKLNADKFGIHVDQDTRVEIKSNTSEIGQLKKEWRNAKKASDKKDATEEQKQETAKAHKQYADKLSENHWDVRVFGSTALEEGDNFIRTGVVQFGVGTSIAKVRIHRDTNTIKAGVDAGKDADRGMAPLGFRIVEHGVYAMPFLINPTAAVHSHCTMKDIELLCRLIPYAYPHTASRIRPMVDIKHAWFFEHKSPLGSCSDFDILDTLTPEVEDTTKPTQTWAEYQYDSKVIVESAKNEFADKFTNFGDLTDSDFVNEAFGGKS